MTLLSLGLMAGCNSNTPAPSSPAGPSAPTSTRTSTITLTPTVTSTATFTSTMTFTPTVTPTPQTAQAAVNLNSLAAFSVVAYTTITGDASTTLCGDVGLFPGSSITGAPVLSCGGVEYVSDGAGVAAQAQADLTTAYNDAFGRTTAAPVSGDLGGKTLYEGLYKSTSTLEVTSGNLTLDAQGHVNAVFIFQIGSIFSIANGRSVLLAGGAKADNVFWQVGSSCALGTTSALVGTILAHDQVTMNSGAVLVGRAFSENEQVTLAASTVTLPTP